MDLRALELGRPAVTKWGSTASPSPRKYSGWMTRGRRRQNVTNDGMDYVPTNKWVLYRHHFAAIAGAGPLLQALDYLARPVGFEATNIPLEISSGNCTAQLLIAALLEHRPDHPHQLAA
jgi:Carbon starvation protein CstA